MARGSPSAAARAPLLLLLFLGCSSLFIQQTSAHGGGLHRWTFNPKVRNVVKTADVRTSTYPYTQVASCLSPSGSPSGTSPWKILNTTALSPSVYPLPFFPATKNISVGGTLDVYSYMGGNCSNSSNTALVPFLQLKEWYRSKGKLLSRPAPTNSIVFGYGFTGPCSAPTNLYRNNITQQDNRFNLAWWDGREGAVGTGMNASDLYPGYLWGASVNPWLLGNSSATNRLRSIVLIVQSGPAFCCDLSYAGFPQPEEVLKKMSCPGVAGGGGGGGGANATNATNTHNDKYDDRR